MNYCNEIDPKAAAWLRELIAAKLIPNGRVDERSITDVTPTDLDGFTQCHFFAGIGGWSRALRIAEWPEDRPVWTGSCPCQPFSVAGKGLGTADARHLWPEFARLIRECRPPVVFGEQVASKAGRGWLAGVRADLEGMGYAVGAADLCAASASPEVAGWIDLGHNEGRIPVSVGPPHIRQRLFWVAQSHHAGRWSVGGPEQNERDGGDLGRQETHGQLGACGEVRGLADSTSYGLERCGSTDPRRSNEGVCPRSDGHGDSGAFGRVGYDSLPGPQGRNERGNGPGQRPARQAGLGFWSSFDVIPCADGKSRCVESGTFPLVARLPGGVVPSGDPGEQEAQATAEARVMRLRGYGNAIVSELASEFVRSTQ